MSANSRRRRRRSAFEFDRADAPLVLSGPDAIIASLPYLIGFHPTDSCVLLWLSGRRLLLTQRLDLPSRTSQVPAWLSAMWRPAAALSADRVILVVIADHGELPE